MRGTTVLCVEVDFLFSPGLMISAYARAGQVLSDPEYTKRAIQGVDFIRNHMYKSESGILLRSSYVGSNQEVVHG